MLSQLIIQNFALIQEASLSFQPRFTVITGETGSGKSILLGSINLILGQRADLSVIRDSDKKTVVEAFFTLDEKRFSAFFEKNDLDFDTQTVIRREITAQGKSRAFINDVPVQLTILKELTEQLINIHSQHETLALRQPDFQLAILDDLSDSGSILENYKKDFTSWKKLVSALESMKSEQHSLVSQLDYNRFQFEELQRLNLGATDFESFEEELNRGQKVDDLKQIFAGVATIFGGENTIVDLLNKAKLLTEKQLVDSQVNALNTRIKELYFEAKDIQSESEKLLEQTEIDPARLEFLNEQLNAYQQLLRKHNVKSQVELVSVMNAFDEKVNTASNLEEKLASLEVEVYHKFELVKNSAERLHEHRQSKIKEIENELIQRLTDVKLPETTVVFDLHNTNTFGNSGSSKLDILFSPNKGISPKPIEKAASGGELSRFMLILQMMLSKKKVLPTLIFDEIDTGVSGDVAQRVGTVLKEMGQSMQLFAITHLPQVAAKGEHHLKVSKSNENDKTLTKIVVLNPEERIIEIAQLMSGSEVNNAALENAKALMLG